MKPDITSIEPTPPSSVRTGLEQWLSDLVDHPDLLQAVRDHVVGPQQQARFPPLESVTRPTVDTAAAAYYLNRSEQTLRLWACKQNGALRPLRIKGRLAWPVAELRRVLGEGA